MKNTFALSVLALGISSFAFGGACSQASLATYIQEGSCTVGAYTFNNFAYFPVTVFAGNPGAGQIMVNATVSNGNPDVTFTPGAGFSAGGLISAANYLFGFEVSDSSGIDFQSVNLGATAAVTLLGTAVVTEVDCNGGLLQLPNQVTGTAGVACLTGGISTGTTATLSLGSVSALANIQLAGTDESVDVLKNVTLAAVLGSSTVTSIDQQFTTTGGTSTPEPASFFLGGCGLVGLALVGRRKAKGGSKTTPSCL
jgi:hypothetical protein